MDKKVIVTIKSTQTVENDEEVIELVTPGKFYKKENAFYVVYDETEISGMKGTTTTLRIEDENVNLIRFGTTNSHLKFKEGVEDVSFYKTPYGVLELVITPFLVDVHVDDSGGEVKLKYELDAGGQQTSKNELYIKVSGGKLQ